MICDDETQKLLPQPYSMIGNLQSESVNTKNQKMKKSKEADGLSPASCLLHGAGVISKVCVSKRCLSQHSKARRV